MKKGFVIITLGLFICSCGNTEYFLNSFDIGINNFLPNYTTNTSTLWDGGEDNNHTYEIKYGETTSYFGAYLSDFYIHGFKSDFRHSDPGYYPVFTMNDNIINGKYFYVAKKRNQFRFDWVEYNNFSDINYIHKNKKLVFLVEKKEVTFVSDLFTKEELNLTKDLYNNVILKVDEDNLLVRVTDTDDPTLTREEGDRDIISLAPTYLENDFISSPYFGYPKVSNAIIPIEKYEDKDVIMLPTSIILENETKSLFDEGIKLSDDDVFGKYRNNFKEFMVKEKVATKEIGTYFKDKVECSYFDLDKIKEFVYYTNN